MRGDGVEEAGRGRRQCELAEGHGPEFLVDHVPHQEAAQKQFLHDRHHDHEAQRPHGEKAPGGRRPAAQLLEGIEAAAFGGAIGPAEFPLQGGEHDPRHHEQESQQQRPPLGAAHPAVDRLPEAGEHRHGQGQPQRIDDRVGRVGNAQKSSDATAAGGRLENPGGEEHDERHDARPPRPIGALNEG